MSIPKESPFPRDFTKCRTGAENMLQKRQKTGSLDPKENPRKSQISWRVSLYIINRAFFRSPLPQSSRPRCVFVDELAQHRPEAGQASQPTASHGKGPWPDGNRLRCGIPKIPSNSNGWCSLCPLKWSFGGYRWGCFVHFQTQVTMLQAIGLLQHGGKCWMISGESFFDETSRDDRLRGVIVKWFQNITQRQWWRSLQNDVPPMVQKIVGEFHDDDIAQWWGSYAVHGHWKPRGFPLEVLEVKIKKVRCSNWSKRIQKKKDVHWYIWISVASCRLILVQLPFMFFALMQCIHPQVATGKSCGNRDATGMPQVYIQHCRTFINLQSILFHSCSMVTIQLGSLWSCHHALDLSSAVFIHHAEDLRPILYHPSTKHPSTSWWMDVFSIYSSSPRVTI